MFTGSVSVLLTSTSLKIVFFYFTCSSPENETEADQRQANKKQMEKDQVSETFLLVVISLPVCLL